MPRARVRTSTFTHQGKDCDTARNASHRPWVVQSCSKHIVESRVPCRRHERSECTAGRRLWYFGGGAGDHRAHCSAGHVKIHKSSPNVKSNCHSSLAFTVEAVQLAVAGDRWMDEQPMVHGAAV